MYHDRIENCPKLDRKLLCSRGVSASTVQPACLMVMGSGAGVEPPRLPPSCVRAYVANNVCYMFACDGAAHVEWALACRI